MNIRVICNFNKGLLFYKSTLGTRHSFVIGIGKILSSYLVEGVYEFALSLWKCTCQTIQLNLLRVQFHPNSLHEILIAHDCEYFQFLAERTVLYEIEGALLSNHRCYIHKETRKGKVWKLKGLVVVIWTIWWLELPCLVNKHRSHSHDEPYRIGIGILLR